MSWGSIPVTSIIICGVAMITFDRYSKTFITLFRYTPFVGMLINGVWAYQHIWFLLDGLIPYPFESCIVQHPVIYKVKLRRG